MRCSQHSAWHMVSAPQMNSVLILTQALYSVLSPKIKHSLSWRLKSLFSSCPRIPLPYCPKSCSGHLLISISQSGYRTNQPLWSLNWGLTASRFLETPCLFITWMILDLLLMTAVYSWRLLSEHTSPLNLPFSNLNPSCPIITTSS